MMKNFNCGGSKLTWGIVTDEEYGIYAYEHKTKQHIAVEDESNPTKVVRD